MGIKVEGASKRFGDFDALNDVTVDVPDGSLTALLGPSGSGKSTLLRAIAGLLPAEQGAVYTCGQPALLGVNAALLDDLTGERNARAREALARVGLINAADLRPRELSGGMAQRAGLARALIGDPPVLLLDEPFSALDALSREAFDSELQGLWLERPRTVVLEHHPGAPDVRWP